MIRWACLIPGGELSDMIVFESWSKLLLFLHLLCAIGATGAAMHLLLRLRRACAGSDWHSVAVVLHARTMAALYLLAYGLGAMVYPTFRIRVRRDYFDLELPWATALFEIKEHAATLALVPAVAVWLLAHSVNVRDEADRRYVPLLAGLALVVLAVLVFNSVAGWYLSSLRSV